MSERAEQRGRKWGYLCGERSGGEPGSDRARWNPDTSLAHHFGYREGGEGGGSGTSCGGTRGPFLYWNCASMLTPNRARLPRYNPG